MPPDGLDGTVGPAPIDALIDAYPLAAAWGAPEVFEQVVEIMGLPIHLVGLCARRGDGTEVTGSAAGVGRAPRERAYFELLERVAILDAVTRPPAAFRLLGSDGRDAGTAEASRVFPVSPEGGSLRYALSNGVAAGSSFEHARRSAEHELIERDRVLRSWYGAIAPARIEDADLGPLAPLSPLYSLEAFEFPSPGDRETNVVGLFGFPRVQGAPFIRGMGAGRSRLEAESHAVRECLQTLGFLWGETLPELEPEFSTTAEYHQEYYLWPESQARLRRWLGGEHLGFPLVSRSPGPPRPRRFADLTPTHLACRVHVLKALPEGELPLVFGKGHPLLEGPLEPDLEVHPIS